MPKPKKRILSRSQRFLDEFLFPEPEPVKVVDIPKERTLSEDFEKFLYKFSGKEPSFALTKRNALIIQHLRITELTVDEIASLLEMRPQTVYVELKYLESNGLVRRV